MKQDLRGKFVHLSDVLVELPSVKRLLAYLVVAAFFAGFLIRFSHGRSLFDAALFGGLEGFWLLFLPAVLAAALASSLYHNKFFQYFLSTSLVSAVVVGLSYVLSVLVFNQFKLGLSFLALLGNAFGLVIWFVAAYVILSSRPVKALVVSVVYPVFNIAFLVSWNLLGVAESSLPLDVSFVTLFKFAVAAGILLLSLGALFYVINAPSRRNFGVSTMQALTLFFAQWIQGDKGLEEFLGRFGEQVTTLIGAVAFKAKSGRLKAVFLVPHVHFGPFGNLGGSAFPAVLSKRLKRVFGAETFVFHPLVTHDLNPVHSNQATHLGKECEALVSSLASFSPKGFIAESQVRENQVGVMGFGRKAFFSITRAPHSTEDFELSVGVALRNLALRRFDDALVVDRHNSLTDGEMYDVGSDVYYAYADALSALEPEAEGVLSLGVSSDALEDFSLEQGHGAGGMKVAVLGFGRKKACVVWVDANNALPSFRDAVRERLKEFGFVDLFTSDTHSVNTVGGIHNPLGAHPRHQELLDRISACVARAEKDVEPVSAALSSRRVSLSVLGIQRQAELVTTVNAIVSVAKIVAPVMFFLALVLVFFAFLVL
ncbi:DUF2070 family protein [Candidatus Micrarchaeota archaeon]|nr:DUF2070 family protein [Candidatus Micrarchaeota archaeon]